MAIGARYWTLGKIRDHVASPLESEADWVLAEAAPLALLATVGV